MAFNHVKKIVLILLISFAFLGVQGKDVVAQTDSDPFPWTMFLPGITNETPVPVLPKTYWSALSFAVCADSVATFSLTAEGITKNSVMPAGGPLSSFEGWVTTTPGTKSFNWVLSSTACGSGGSTFAYTLEENKNYSFQLDVDPATRNPFVQVVIGTGIPSGARLGADLQKYSIVEDALYGTKQVVDIFPLDNEKEIFTSGRKSLTRIKE